MAVKEETFFPNHIADQFWVLNEISLAQWGLGKPRAPGQARRSKNSVLLSSENHIWWEDGEGRQKLCVPFGNKYILLAFE